MMRRMIFSGSSALASSELRLEFTISARREKIPMALRILGYRRC
jgi:hypothetical protein